MAGTDPSMEGKMCLVTGATTGIGWATARELARLGGTVVIVGRSRERCAKATESLRRDSGNAAIECIPADLSLQAEVRRLAWEYQQRYDRLDILVNNVGALFAYREE